MHRSSRLVSAVVTAGFLLTMSGAAFAQTAPSYAQPAQQPQPPPAPQYQQPDDQLPPPDQAPQLQAADAANGPAVARVSFVEGAVSVERGDTTEPLAAVVNAPVLAGDYLATGENARGEVQFDAVSMVRLDENTQLRIARLDAPHEVQLAQGTIELATLQGSDGRPQVDTPSVSVQMNSGGLVRVSVTPDGQTAVTVRRGSAAVQAPAGEQVLHAGQSLIAQGSTADATTRLVAQIAGDSFDRFNEQRDGAQVAALQAPEVQEVAPIDGVGDLNAYGQWTDDTQYGEVWQPTGVAADWAPYRDGRWVWEDGWGYTWVAAEPWGWAPYHYGSWFYRDNAGWAWVPPHRSAFAVGYAAPPWRPAMVGFLTFGVGAVSVGLGFGNVGWVPLAPGEPWHSWYGGYGGRSVVIADAYVTSGVHYRNMLAVRGGVTSVSAGDFQAGRFGHPVAVAPGELRSARLGFVRGALPIVPTTANLRFSDRPATAFVRSPVFARPAFTARIAPSVAQRAPFEQQRAHVDTTVRAYQTRSLNGEAGAVRGGGAANDAWSRYSSARGNANVNSGYSRGATGTTPAYSRPQNSGAADRTNGYARPGYGSPSYSRPQTNGSGGYARPQTNGGYARPQTNGYSRSSGSYARPAQRTQGTQAARPAAHPPAAAREDRGDRPH